MLKVGIRATLSGSTRVLARKIGVPGFVTASVDGTKIDANASRVRFVRHVLATALREKLAADIAAAIAQAEAADAAGHDLQAVPALPHFGIGGEFGAAPTMRGDPRAVSIGVQYWV